MEVRKINDAVAMQLNDNHTYYAIFPILIIDGVEFIDIKSCIFDINYDFDYDNLQNYIDEESEKYSKQGYIDLSGRHTVEYWGTIRQNSKNVRVNLCTSVEVVSGGVCKLSTHTFKDGTEYCASYSAIHKNGDIIISAIIDDDRDTDCIYKIPTVEDTTSEDEEGVDIIE